MYISPIVKQFSLVMSLFVFLIHCYPERTCLPQAESRDDLTVNYFSKLDHRFFFPMIVHLLKNIYINFVCFDTMLWGGDFMTTLRQIRGQTGYNNHSPKNAEKF